MSDTLELMELLGAIERRIADAEPGSRCRAASLRAARTYVAAARRRLRDAMSLDERIALRAGQ
jgi:hypothetical protein